MCIPAQPERIQQLARESETTSGHLHFKQKTLLKQAQILMTPPFQTIRQKAAVLNRNQIMNKTSHYRLTTLENRYHNLLESLV